MRILFIDPVCPSPYAQRTLREGALGGTEATVVRVAEGLAARGHTVRVAQHTRTEAEAVGLVGSRTRRMRSRRARRAGPRWRWSWYCGHTRRSRASAAIIPTPPCFCGDTALPEAAAKPSASYVRETGAHAVTVSRHHADTLRQFVAQTSGDAIPISTCYNPVDLMPDDTPVQANKLVFFSSPHKGLDQVLRAFEAVRAWRTDWQLFVANPGYLSQDHALPRGVVTLGALPHEEVIRHVREAFCVFYPQATFAETFGLVFAEANAVGTPVLAHSLGSAAEVLGETLAEARQLVDCRRAPSGRGAVAAVARNRTTPRRRPRCFPP